ncbi:Fis family transcriptional regulator [Sorangium cellulosum]|uniref:Fis family transcriptional regulator n=1 Tax=Sorangium cellulosum TaxID=56 RepID=A0A2L0EPT8_SORCE|nr:sigma-54 dependent transcriptional regulator [Sorangium cellulosum]AUX41304.1 Fis family transcriptional regulator [Sorangium cellulosum]
MRLLTLPTPDSTTPPTERASALVFEDPRSQRLLQRVKQLAQGDAPVLLRGETGTGKEILARHLHELSARRGQPFIAVSCGALAASRAEGELFGHEQLAFTGTLALKRGLLELADGGTLFLDEIGDLPLGLQARLLRVLQERAVVRPGARHAVPIDVRVVATTSVPLENVAAAGAFRDDLLSRLSGATLAVPPLRERPGDIVPLARYFLATCARRLAATPAVLAASAAEPLLAHGWPGNIRELEHVIHQAFLVCRGGRVTRSDLRFSGSQPKPPSPALPGPQANVEGLMAALESTVAALFESEVPGAYERIEEIVTRTVYRRCERNLGQTARVLGVTRETVRARLLQSGEIGTPTSEPPVPSLRSGDVSPASRGVPAVHG